MTSDEDIPPADAVVQVERTLTGRLRDAYPAGARDVELKVDPSVPTDALTAVLTGAYDAVRSADPACRRVIFAVHLEDLATIAAAEAAGFRYVVDVDLPDETGLSLLVAEPAWATSADTDLEHPPDR